MARCHLRPLTYLLMGMPIMLVAQSSTTAALQGTVKDTAGKPVSGAEIRIEASTLIGGERKAKTSENGSYRFPALPPGLYKITISAPGYTTRTDLELLELGRSSTVNTKLAATASAVVEVVATNVSAEPTPTAVTQNFRTDDLQTLPIGRDLTSIANLTPGINNGTAWGGDRGGANAYLLDGVNVGDPNGGTQWIQVNPDWFEEVQIGGVGAAAEYGGFSGGVFNAITKSGGNEFKGDFSAYYQSDTWSANRYLPDPSFPNDPSKNLKMVANKYQDFGFSVGGPILKDKVWYFLSAQSITETRFPVGAPTSYERKTPRVMGKLTWQALPTATFGMMFDVDNVVAEHRGASRESVVEATTKQESPNFSFGASWLQTLTDSMVLNLRITGYNGKDDRKAYNGENYSLVLDAGAPAYYGPLAGYVYLNNASSVAENTRSRIGFLASLDYFKSGLFTANDSHAFKMGLDIEQAKSEERTRYPGNVQLYGTVYKNEVDTDYVAYGGGSNIKASMNRTAFYIQDTWTVNSRLTLRPGIRFEQFEGKGTDAGGSLWKSSNVAPRLGITFALTEDQRSMVKFHFGRFYDGINVYYFDRTIPGAFPVEKLYYWGDYTMIKDLRNPLASEPLPNFATDKPFRTYDDFTRIDGSIKHPYTDEFILAFDQKVGKDWTLGISAMQRKTKDMIVWNDLGKGAASTVTNPLTGEKINTYNPETTDFYLTNNSQAKREFTSVTLSVDGKITKDWDLTLNLTQSDLKGNINRSNGYDAYWTYSFQDVNREGKLPGYVADEIKFRTSYRAPWNMVASLSFAYTSGEHWTRTFQSSRFKNGRRAQFYAEPMGSQQYPCRRVLDLRLTQRFQLTKTVRLDVFGDVYNLLNSDAITSSQTRVSSPTTVLYPLNAEEPRTARLGMRLAF